VALLGVSRNAYNGGVTLLKLSKLLLKCVEFCRTDKGEILGIEEENNVFFSNELIEGVVGDKLTAVDNGRSGEIRSGFSYEYRHNVMGVFG
jgi:hypothetical protein